LKAVPTAAAAAVTVDIALQPLHPQPDGLGTSAAPKFNARTQVTFRNADITFCIQSEECITNNLKA
jgi:hypothetical protein